MNLKRAMCVFVLGMLPVPKISYAGQSLIAAGALDASGGDLAGKTSKPLENSVAGNLFGGIGSGLGHASGDRFIVRLSRDGKSIFVSDEYGPYIYRFDRESGVRTGVFNLPDNFAVDHLDPVGDVEITANSLGRVANKGMEGLAITPDGSTLVGIMQSALAQDGGDNDGQVLRIVMIDIESGAVTHQYAYQTDTDKKYTASDIVAVNDHVFLVDERDGKGFGDGSEAKFKKLFLIDLAGATDVTNLSGHDDLAAHAVSKRLFLNVVTALKSGLGVTGFDIPAKLEGIAFGEDVLIGGVAKHTLFVANDNDFLPVYPAPPAANGKPNPNQFFVFAFTDANLQAAFGDAAHAELTLEPQIFDKK